MPEFVVSETEHHDIVSIQSPNAPHCDNGLLEAMRARELAEQERAERLAKASENTSGFNPLDVRVLVRPDPVEEVTKGGIILAPTHTEREQMAQIKGTLVAVGVNAWGEAKENPAFEAPQPGARVLIAKYGGIVVDGRDGQKYRIMNDVDVTAVIEGE